MRYFIELSYNGKSYSGWQIQKNAHTVQQEINDALRTCLRDQIETVGSGRTDAGVHAKQQFCHADLKHQSDIEQLVYKLNTILPADIAIHNIYPVAETSHARFDAVSRSYEYHITRDKDPFCMDTNYYFKQALNLTKMNQACNLILGEHDFGSFCKSRTNVDNFYCNVSQAQWQEYNGKYCFYVSANRFLRGMVRALVGTLMEVGTGKIVRDQFQEILDAKDRRKAGRSVPAHGLFLVKVLYPQNLLADN